MGGGGGKLGEYSFACCDPDTGPPFEVGLGCGGKRDVAGDVLEVEGGPAHLWSPEVGADGPEAGREEDTGRSAAESPAGLEPSLETDLA
jgi:hypothetical protein